MNKKNKTVESLIGNYERKGKIVVSELVEKYKKNSKKKL